MYATPSLETTEVLPLKDRHPSGLVWLGATFLPSTSTTGARSMSTWLADILVATSVTFCWIWAGVQCVPMYAAQGRDPTRFAMRWMPPPSSSVITNRPRWPGTWDFRVVSREPRSDGALLPNSSTPPAPALTSEVTSDTEVSDTGTAMVSMASRWFDHPASFVLLVHAVEAVVRCGANGEGEEESAAGGAGDTPEPLECGAALGVPVPQPARSIAATAAAVLSLRAFVARPGSRGGAVALVRSRYDGRFIARPPSGRRDSARRAEGRMSMRWALRSVRCAPGRMCSLVHVGLPASRASESAGSRADVSRGVPSSADDPGRSTVHGGTGVGR